MGTKAGAGGGSATVVQRQARWRVHEWEVSAGGAALCRAAAVRAAGGLLVWVGGGGGGGGGGPGALGGVALALPAGEGRALGTVLAPGPAGEGEAAVALARRLAQRLSRPVHVCCGTVFDRFTAPLVERALVAEIKSRPDFF